MGEAKRRKKLDPNYGKSNPLRGLGSKYCKQVHRKDGYVYGF